MLLGQVLGSVGLVLLLSTVLTFIIAGSSTFLIYGKLLLGVGFIVAYFVTNKDQARKMMGNRSTALLALSIGSGAFFIALVVALNYIGYKNNKEYDLTREGVFTLADQTVKTLEGLKDEVKVLGFYRSDEPQYRQAKEILERYSLKSSQFTYEFIDPVQKPELVERHQIKEGSSRLVFTAKGANEAKPKDLSEQELTNALVKVQGATQKKIYFLTGHGEPALDEQTPDSYGQIASALRAEGYNVDQFSFLGQGAVKAGDKLALDPAAAQSGGELKVPADAGVVIVAGAITPVSSVEIETLSQWAQKGGKLFIALDTKSNSGLEKLASAWHIDVRNDMVVDTSPINRVLGMGPAMALVQTYDSHPITKDFRQPIALPMTRSLDIKLDDAGRIAGAKPQVLARSSKTSWGETDYASGTAEYNQGKDAQGPQPLIALSTKSSASEPDKVSDEGRVIVSGDSEFINNKYSQAQANADFFINSINWLADEEGKISIRPKQRGASRIMLTENEAAVIKFFSIDILPVALFATGMAIRQVRRRK